MKSLFISFLLTLACLPGVAQQILSGNDYIYKYQMSVGKTNASPINITPSLTSVAAWLEIGRDSTNKGILLPRVVDTSLVLNPVKGLFLYQTKDSTLYYHNKSRWVKIADDAILNDYLKISDSTVYYYPLNSNPKGYITTETDPVANNKTVTLTQLPGIIIGSSGSQIVGNNPSFGISADFNTALWNANKLRGIGVSVVAPTLSQILQFNGLEWAPATVSSLGTVTSVGLSLPSDVYNITGSPVTTTGTLTGTFKPQFANLFFASPNGINGLPSFRAFANEDLPISGVTPGIYGSSSEISVVTINDRGIVTNASNVAAKIIDTVSTISALMSYTGSASVVQVLDSLRGDLFVLKTTTQPSDSGIVFPSFFVGKKWIRQRDKVDEVHADWWEDILNNSAVKKAITYINSVGGGSVYLSKKAYFPTGYDINNKMSFNNISIVGVKKPYYNSDCSGLENGSILMGSFVVSANNFTIRNVGIDMGLNVSNTYLSGAEGDGFAVAVPTTASYNPVKNITVDGIVTLCKSPESLFHAALFEGIEGAYINDVTCTFGIHGIVIKGVNIQADNLKSYAHSVNGIILKSDLYAPLNKVQIGSFVYDSIPPLTSPYTNARCDNGINIVPSESLGAISISNATVFHADNGILAAGTNTIGNFYIGSLVTDATTTAISLQNATFKRFHVDNANISNSFYAVNAGGNMEVYPLNINSLFAENVAITGNTAVTLVDSARLNVGYMKIEGYANEYSLAGGAKLFANNDSTHGTYSATNYQILTNGTPKVTVSPTGNVGINNINPLSKLSVSGATAIAVNGSASITPHLYMENAAHDRAFNLQLTDGAFPGLGLWGFNGAWVEAMRITSSGNTIINGNATFASNGTPGIGKEPTGTDGSGNWTWQQKAVTSLEDFLTDVANSSVGTYSQMYVYTIPANTLTTDGDKIKATYGGDFAANGNTKGLQVFINGTGSGASDEGAFQGGWSTQVTFIRTGATTGRFVCNYGTLGSRQVNLVGLDFTTTITFEIWGKGGAASDVTARQGDIAKYTAAP